jgi:hypothetical protein
VRLGAWRRLTLSATAVLDSICCESCLFFNGSYIPLDCEYMAFGTNLATLNGGAGADAGCWC